MRKCVSIVNMDITRNVNLSRKKDNFKCKRYKIRKL